MMAAEAGIEVGTFNLAWLCEENKVDTAFSPLIFDFMFVLLLDMFVVIFVFIYDHWNSTTTVLYSMDNNYGDILLIVFFFVFQYYFAYIIMLASI